MSTISTFGGFLPDNSLLEFNECADVSITSPQNGDFLAYDVDAGVWKNRTILESSVVQYVGDIVTQASHGFGIMDQIYKKTDGSWALAKADSSSTLRGASVYAVVDADTFKIIFSGVANINSHGFTVGSIYYLSASVAGAVTSTPVDAISYYNQAIFTVLDANSLQLHEDVAPPGILVIPTTVSLDSKPSEQNSETVSFNLGTYNNDGAAPYSDNIHFNTASSASEGDQTVISFSKESGVIGARMFQGTYASSSSYSRYRDFLMTSENSANIDSALPIMFNFSSGVLFKFTGVSDGPYMSHGVDADFVLSYVAGRLSDTGLNPVHLFHVQYSGGDRDVVRFDYSTLAAYNYNGESTWRVLSDRRVKKNIEPLVGCLEKINRLRPVHFQYIKELKCPGLFSGFVAQEFEEVFPRLVNTLDRVASKTNVKAISGDITPYLVGSIKELNEETDSKITQINENYNTLVSLSDMALDLETRIKILQNK